MKYLIVLADGAGGEPIEALGGKTTLEAADMKYTKELAAKGQWWAWYRQYQQAARREATPATCQ